VEQIVQTFFFRTGGWNKFYEKFKHEKTSVNDPFIDWYDEIYLIEVQTGTPCMFLKESRAPSQT
jgi:hypothetical protein